MTKTIGIPEGTRDRLFAECSSCREVERAVTDLFSRRGYCEMTTPNVEYYDLIPAAGYPLSQESMMKIVDRTGKILVMRPDNTVAIGRVAATKLRSLPLPLRLYYDQTVFRSDDINTGARTEIQQCGVELIGASGLRSDVEMISMAIDTLEACGLDDYHIEIGHAGYFAALLSQLPLDAGEKTELRRLVEEKNFVSFDTMLSPYQDTQAGKALRYLPRLFGGPEVLKKARALCMEPEALEAVAYLEEIYQVLEGAGLSHRVKFDLSLIQNIEYYTGIIFRGFGQGAGSNVISGGRYDKLIGQFGADIPATGFALDVEAVAGCLRGAEHRRPDTLVWYALCRLGDAEKLLDARPPQSAMLSCASTPEAAAEEARLLGAARLIVLDGDGDKEVSL